MRARGEVPVAVIEGAAGMGKSSLVLRWAHDHADDFRDGQLYADLGEDPASTALLVLHGFLGALGAEPSTFPQEVGPAAALYRSVLAERAVLVVLENVTSIEQVLPFVPGTATSVVVVTSRTRLAGPDMNSVTAVHLGELAQAEAAKLLHAYLGEDVVSGDQESVAALVDCCAGLPLALAIVAARAAENLDLSGLVAELDDADDELDVFDSADGHNKLRTVFTWAYSSLSDEDAQVLRLLGVSPANELTEASAASLLAP